MNFYKIARLLCIVIFLGFLNIPAILAQENLISEVDNLYLNKLIAAAKENYPRFKQVNSAVNVAKSDLSVSRASWLDAFSFQYVARSNQPSTALVEVQTADLLTGYQFGVSISPGLLLSKPSAIKIAKEKVKMAEYSVEEYYLTLEAEVKKRYYIYLLSQRTLVPINNTFLDTENSYKISKLAYQKGEITLQSYLSASASYNQSYAAKLQAEVNFLSAKASLEEYTVNKLEEIK
ncbi:MAG: TolC family protein [Bacteroidota bacterium]